MAVNGNIGSQAWHSAMDAHFAQQMAAHGNGGGMGNPKRQAANRKRGKAGRKASVRQRKGRK